MRFEPVGEFRRARATRPRRGELQGERQAVEALADSANWRTVAEAGVHVTGALDEQGGGVVQRERLDAVLALAPDPERDPTRREHRRVRRAPDETHDRRRRFEQMLEVVEHEQQPLALQPFLELVRIVEREYVRNCSRHEVGIAERSEVDQVDAVPELVDHPRRRLDREPRLPGAAGACERDDRVPAADELDDLLQLGLATDELRRRHRQVRVRRRLLGNERLTKELEKALRGRRQRNAARVDDGDRAREAPARDVEDHEPPRLELEVERKPADRGNAGALGDGELDRLPGLQRERRNGVQSHLPAGGLDGCPRRGSFLARQPGEPFELLGTQPSSAQRGRPDQDNVVLDKWLALELGGHGQSADDAELGLVRSHELERARRGRHLELELDAGMTFLEPREKLGEEVGAGDARGGDRQRAGLGLLAGCERPAGVGQQRLGTEHVVREYLAGGRECRALAATRDEPLAHFRLERGQVLGDRGLAHVELLRRA